MISFASDNHAGVHPLVFEWMNKVNEGFAPSYGVDSFTTSALQKFKDVFGEKSETFFVWNGTAANVLSLQCMLHSHQAVICSDVAHIHLDECGAPEKFTGSKLIALPSQNGKISLADAKACFEKNVGDVQSVQPKVISLSQTTEYGTVYSLEEMKAFSKLAHDQGGYLHIDGARITNAAVALNCSLQQLINDTGVDVLSFGGTKNGLLGAEAVVILNPSLAKDFKYIRKQGLHLASKMRFISAQFLAYFDQTKEGHALWKQNAEHANQMAKKLAKLLEACRPTIKLTRPVEANAVFATLPQGLIDQLLKEFRFYIWSQPVNSPDPEVRLMCSFETTEEQLNHFVHAIKTKIPLS